MELHVISMPPQRQRQDDIISIHLADTTYMLVSTQNMDVF